MLQGELPPLPLSGDWTLLLPEQFSHSPVEDPRPALELKLLAQELPMVSKTCSFDSPDQLAKLLLAEEDRAMSGRFILAIQGARLQPRYCEVLGEAAKAVESLVVLLLDDPRDLSAMPESKELVVLCAHGTRPLHLQILAEVLRGETGPTGGQPL